MPERTVAIVVGIERYGWAECGDLNGPAADACRFVDWLMRGGVPAKNIRLFLSPLPDNDQIRPEHHDSPRPIPAHREAIEEGLFDDLLGGDVPDRLYFFWGGHGLTDGDNDRHLITADGYERLIKAVNFDGLLRHLRRGNMPPRQVFLVDACANVVTDQAPASTKFASVDAGVPTRQTQIYAAAAGEAARNLSADGTGLFSKHLQATLDRQDTFPPDFERVYAEVREALQLSGQTPQKLEVVIDGNRREIVDEAELDRRGTLVPKLYDRVAQDAIFHVACSQQLKQRPGFRAYLLHGNEYEVHGSLCERLVRVQVHRLVEKLFGTEAGTVYEVGPVSWVGGAPTTGEAKEILAAGLIAAAESEAAELTSAGAILRASPCFSGAYSAVVVAQQIVISTWTEAEAELLNWYFGQFWADSAPLASEPSVILFALIEWPETLPSERVDDLKATLKAIEAKVPSVRLLAELNEVPEQDVRAWVENYLKPSAVAPINVIDEARRICETTKRRRDGRRRTDALEDLLRDAHRAVTRRKRVTNE